MKHYVIRTKPNEYKLVSREQYLSVYNDCIVLGRYFIKYFAEMKLSELIEDNNPYKTIKQFANLTIFIILLFNLLPNTIVNFNYDNFPNILSTSIVLLFILYFLYKTFTVVFDMFVVEYKHLYKLIYNIKDDTYVIINAKNKVNYEYKLCNLGDINYMYKETKNSYKSSIGYVIGSLIIYILFVVLWFSFFVDFKNLYFYTDFSGCTFYMIFLINATALILLECNKIYTIIKYFIKK